MSVTFERGDIMEHRIMGGLVLVALAVGIYFPSGVIAAGGTAQGETTDVKGQQGLGLPGSESSNVMTGGPEVIEGKITGIQGEHFSIRGEHGQNITLRVTKDTNKVCAKSPGTRFSTGQEGVKEHQEIAPTASMEKQAGTGGQRSKPSQQDVPPTETGALSRDPNELKEMVGTTDTTAKEDVARGSGFIVGGKDCTFTPGDQVRIEASDMGTATTIKQISQASGG
jgi:hypothetical protein